MTTKDAFSPGEWKAVLEGPPVAGMIVITASRGGMFRETVAMSKAYVDARAEHGDGEFLDEIVAAKPQADHTRYRAAEELRDNGLRHLRDAVALVQAKATASPASSAGAGSASRSPAWDTRRVAVSLSASRESSQEAAGMTRVPG